MVALLLRLLRDAAWLTPARVRLWGAALALVMLGGALGLVATTRDGIAINGEPVAGDFLSFWAAASLALAGRPAAAYDVQALVAAQAAAFPTLERFFAFFYPPVFLLLCLPLALLPYGAAVGAWLAATFALYWAGLRALLPERWGVLPALGFPALLVNFRHGQNGFLSAGLFAGAAVLLERRPVLAGACLGCLAFKPQLALAVPVALAAAGRWPAFLAAGATALGLAGLSWLALGTASWLAFLDGAALARRALEEAWVGDEKMISLFAGLRLAGAGLGTAYAAQAVLALAVLAALAWALRRRPGGCAEVAALAAATLLCSPFLLDYDLMLAAVPLAWLLREARRDGFLPWEKVVLLLAFLWPLAARLATAASGLPLTPLVALALFAAVLRRLARAPGPAEVQNPVRS